MWVFNMPAKHTAAFCQPGCCSRSPVLPGQEAAVLQVLLQPLVLAANQPDLFGVSSAQAKPSGFHQDTCRRVGLQVAGGIQKGLPSDCVCAHVVICTLLLSCYAHLPLVFNLYLRMSSGSARRQHSFTGAADTESDCTLCLVLEHPAVPHW